MITLSKEGGLPAILSPMAAKKLLAEGTDTLLVFGMVGAGLRVAVELKDGTAATLSLTEEGIGQPSLLDDSWPATSECMPALLTQRFYAHTRAFFELDITCSVDAVDEPHAEMIVKEVLRGERPAPPGFQVIISAEETNDFIERYKAAIKSGNVQALGITDAIVTGYTNPTRRELTYAADNP